MSPKRKEERGPKKLIHFFQPSAAIGLKDGAGRRPSTKPTSHHYSDLPEDSPPDDSAPSTALIPPSPTTESPSSSPAKSRQKLSHTEPVMSAAADSLLTQAYTPAPSPIANIQTSNQPVMDTLLKEMLLTLHTSLQTELTSFARQLTTEVNILGSRVNQVENAIGDMTLTVNDLVDAHEENLTENEWIKSKIADLEDRSRRNNLKLRGVPETVQPADLKPYALQLFKAILPDTPDIELTIDRIHRVPKPSFLPASVPRDVIMKIHFFHTKELILTKARSLGQLPHPYGNIQMFTDLSKYTLDLRRKLNTITKALRNHKIEYKWRQPSKLIITKDGSTHVVSSLEGGLDLLRTWSIIPDPPQPQDQVKQPLRAPSPWTYTFRKPSYQHR